MLRAIPLSFIAALLCGFPNWGIGAVSNVKYDVYDLINLLSTSNNSTGNLSDVQFLLWTRSNPGDDEHYRLLPWNLTNLNDSPFDASLPTHFMYHGYEDHGKCEWIIKAKTVLLEMYDWNIISVDWQTLVVGPLYNIAVENAYLVGNYTAGLIDWLHAERGLSTSQIHIVGHSLGAQTAGFAGKYVTSGQIARVTGLDPAGPLFYEADADHRIDKSDGAYVDIVHGNCGSLLEGCYGLFDAVGHADFYPNGGRHQPGCVQLNETIIDDWDDMIKNCSHARVVDLWVESISAEKTEEMFIAWPCPNYQSYLDGLCQSCGQGCPHMGLHVEEGLEGSYFLRTNAEAPFAMGDQQ